MVKSTNNRHAVCWLTIRADIEHAVRVRDEEVRDRAITMAIRSTSGRIQGRNLRHALTVMKTCKALLSNVFDEVAGTQPSVQYERSGLIPAWTTPDAQNILLGQCQNCEEEHRNEVSHRLPEKIYHGPEASMQSRTVTSRGRPCSTLRRETTC